MGMMIKNGDGVRIRKESAVACLKILPGIRLERIRITGSLADILTGHPSV
jgi:hypothetical protein